MRNAPTEAGALSRTRSSVVFSLESSQPSPFHEQISDNDKGYPQKESGNRRKDDTSCRREPV